MSPRWLILGVLAFARVAMGFQFQAVASVSPFLVAEFGIDYASVGSLIGLYLLPGLVLAMPGGYLGRRFGEKRMVLGGLALMAAGGAISGLGDSYATLVAGRAITGIGVVLQFVLMTKMLADWFSGRDMILAMSLYLNGWPVGIGLALVTQVNLANAWTWKAVFLSSALLSAVALMLVGLSYRSPPGSAGAATTEGSRLSLREITLVSLAGLIWTFVNAGWVIAVSFAPGYLRTQGIDFGNAAGITSLATWLAVIGVPLGGYLASRWPRPNTLIIISTLAGGLAVLAVPFTSAYVFCFAVIGMILFLPAGIMASLPIEVLRPGNRATGLGLFYTWWYLGVAGLPPVAGWTYDLTGSAAAPLLYAAALIFLTLPSLALFRLVQARSRTA
jgi:predicted MFS family arabinose efflux permease